MQSKGKTNEATQKEGEKRRKKDSLYKKIYVETFHNLYSDIHRQLVENKEKNYNLV